jgi:hypothetical protein
MEIDTFDSHHPDLSHADRLRVMAIACDAMLWHDMCDEFNKLALVPLESEPNEHRKERREFR